MKLIPLEPVEPRSASADVVIHCWSCGVSSTWNKAAIGLPGEMTWTVDLEGKPWTSFHCPNCTHKMMRG